MKDITSLSKRALLMVMEIGCRTSRQNSWALKVDVIVTGSNPGALAVKKLTSEIPVVFVTTGDPISGARHESPSPGGKSDRRNRARASN